MPKNDVKSPAQIRFEVLIKTLNLSVYALAKQLDVPQNRISRAMEKKSGIDSDLLEQLSSHFPEVNMDWIVTGRGEMMLTDQPNQVNEPRTVLIRSAPPIRIVYRHQFSDYAANCMDNAYLRQLTSAHARQSEPGVFRDFEMNGPQMADNKELGIMEGDFVRAQLVQQDLYNNILQPGTVVVVVTQKDIFIRMIKEVSPPNLVLKSLSALYPDETIKLPTVREIWLYRSLFTARDFKHKLYE